MSYPIAKMWSRTVCILSNDCVFFDFSTDRIIDPKLITHNKRQCVYAHVHTCTVVFDNYTRLLSKSNTVHVELKSQLHNNLVFVTKLFGVHV